jgi:hypothetical protein
MAPTRTVPALNADDRHGYDGYDAAGCVNRSDYDGDDDK